VHQSIEFFNDIHVLLWKAFKSFFVVKSFFCKTHLLDEILTSFVIVAVVFGLLNHNNKSSKRFLRKTFAKNLENVWFNKTHFETGNSRDFREPEIKKKRRKMQEPESREIT
jgi:hypothetical protein